jgi:hypothetical protein
VNAWRAAARVALAAVLAVAACGCDDGGEGAVRDVPGRYRTIQAAVDAAQPGDLIRIAPGVYRESVRVPASKREIVIRGLDRNRVVLDGGHRRVDGVRVKANGVAVENLTVRRYLANGVLFSPPRGRPTLTGYRASYVTAADNGLYGVYALSSTRGQFDHLYASGHPDSGIYIGQCSPCRAVVTDSVAEHNMVGYENTNASGGIAIVRSTLRVNRVGLALNSEAKEKLAPQHDVQVVGNVVADNNNADAPKGSDAFALGIVISGGSANDIERNRVTGHRGAGILVEPSRDGYQPLDNRVRANTLARNRLDLAVRAGRDLNSLGNCFARNRFVRSAPPRIEAALPCGRPPSALRGTSFRLPEAPLGAPRVPSPPAQPNMPDPRGAPPRPATGMPPRIDVASIEAP